MAKLEMSVDTEAKTMSCKVDGEEVGDLHSVHVYNKGVEDAMYRDGADAAPKDEPHFAVKTWKHEGGKTHHSHTQASAGSALAEAMEELFSRGRRRPV